MASQGIADRIPPQNEDAEKAALGAMLIDDTAIAVVRQFLEPEDFYSTFNKRIYEAIISLYSAGHKADLLTIKGELEKTGKLDEAGGIDYIAGLTHVVPSSANADYYALKVQECSLRRGLIQTAGIAGSKAYDETNDPRLLLEETQQRLFALSDTRRLFTYKKVGKIINATFTYLEGVFNTKAEYTGIPSGFDALDALTSGFQKAELIVIGARPGMGKTAIALTMASNISMGKKKTPAAFFSLEMSDQSLMLRIISAEAKIDSQKLRTGKFDSSDIPNIWAATDRIHQAPLYIVDMPHMTILDIQAMARMLRTQEKVEIIFIDYIGLIGSDNPKLARYELISEVSRSLKGLARELDIPIVALSQLRREAEKEKPNLSDIRESGSIEQDADMVMFINRDRELEKTAEEQAQAEGQVVQLILAKNRNGPVGTINLTFLKPFTKFAPYAGDKH
ncbi:replicative DNA helicase [Leadbettera azotonutricia]|uniref:Replicative DNA helicase n=1 Tax=Leadbettera azotonutricia (strain ATCC BAA-888 / DSM 13862 / ZAS-9) TaxID=545695 RepID=F5YB02_LEAAZ|nr:replicative DNA helicase [Leadbettera azotonutricia]AEF82484.1 replicative DNA helicase [Leadbettera azotonutricia ZAS-9]